jgi:rhamnose transport system substrate-binding protein
MNKYLNGLVCVLVIVMLPLIVLAQDEPVEAEPGQEVDMILLPKFLGIVPFDQAHQGAMEAHEELENPGELIFTGPTPENSVAGQIEVVTNAVTQGVDAIMISNNAGDQIAPAAQAALDAGIKVVTWDSPIPSAEGEILFVAQVDFDQTGQVLADMTLDIIGEEGGQFAILSASPDAANQNAWIAAMQDALESDEKYAGLELVEIVYGNDQSEESYNQALGLIDRYPDLKVIVAPTSVGAPAAAKALQDEGLCGEGTDNSIVVTGLAVPSEMLAYTENGCAPQFALWSFVDLGYLTYYVTYLLATEAIAGEVGETFVAGRMGEYEITEDPTRPDVEARRVLMGPFTVYNIDNIHEAAGEPTGEEAPEATEEGGDAAEPAATEESTGFDIIRQYFGV